MNIANKISLSRIFFGPVFITIYLNHDLFGISKIALPYVLIALGLIATFSDWIDGVLARKYNLVSDLGKVMDPMTDSLSMISVFLTYTLEPINLPMPLVFVFVYRDILIGTLRTLCAFKGVALGASWTGKVKTTVQNIAAFFATFMLLFFEHQIVSKETMQVSSTIAVAIAAGFSIYSGIEYFVKNWPLIKSEIR